MHSLHNLQNAEGAKTEGFRVGRGRGTGNGKTAGKGHKGQGAHNTTKKNGFEGGQTPIARRLPKYGARKTHKNDPTVYAEINLSVLEKYFEEGATVNAAVLVEKKIVKKELSGIKVLGNGKAHQEGSSSKRKAFSASAKKAIEDLGGEAKVIA